MFRILASACALALLLGCRATPGTNAAPKSPAHALLERAIRQHDPGSAWGTQRISIHWTSTRPDGAVGFDFVIDFGPGATIGLRGDRSGHELDYHVDDGVARARVDGESDVPEELRAQLALDRDDGLFWRDYLGFLAGLPMCLADADVRIDPEVSSTRLEGRDVLSLRARFAPDVGSDVWTLYFDPDSNRLLGCRFDRADPTRDGETIVFEGTTSVAGLELPRTRRWYMNADWRFLGTDELRAGR